PPRAAGSPSPRAATAPSTRKPDGCKPSSDGRPRSGGSLTHVLSALALPPSLIYPLAGLNYPHPPMEEPLHSAQTLERELLEFAPDAVIGVDEQGVIVLVNSRTQAVFGYQRDELIGERVEMLVPEAARGDHVSHRDRYFDSPRTRPMGAGLDLHARRK